MHTLSLAMDLWRQGHCFAKDVNSVCCLLSFDAQPHMFLYERALLRFGPPQILQLGLYTIISQIFLHSTDRSIWYGPAWENGCVLWQGENWVDCECVSGQPCRLIGFSGFLSLGFLCLFIQTDVDHLWVARRDLLSVHELDCLWLLSEWCWCAISLSSAHLWDNQSLFPTTTPVERNERNPIKNHFKRLTCNYNST